MPGTSLGGVSAGLQPVTKGYGVADRQTGTPVDPEATAFRIGSFTKPAVTNALMDLIERDDIDPYADVSRYLDVPISEYKNESVPLANIVKHRAGFKLTNSGR